jgi:hypothetical protein
LFGQKIDDFHPYFFKQNKLSVLVPTTSEMTVDDKLKYQKIQVKAPILIRDYLEIFSSNAFADPHIFNSASTDLEEACHFNTLLIA